ncbi:MAG: hypothetical protein J1E41_01680 [Ruminococcus sp.]|nr:hypothetical protein [Ruminococcus sp.]
MRKKLKKIAITTAVVFFAVVAILTYFSETIDRMLLPQVKTCEAVLSDLKGNTRIYNKYLVPKSVLTVEGDTGTFYYAHRINDDSDEAYVYQMDVVITGSDELYYEVSNGGGDFFTTSLQLVYSTSKSISDGDRVYVVEEEFDEE